MENVTEKTKAGKTAASEAKIYFLTCPWWYLAMQIASMLFVFRYHLLTCRPPAELRYHWEAQLIKMTLKKRSRAASLLWNNVLLSDNVNILPTGTAFYWRHSPWEKLFLFFFFLSGLLRAVELKSFYYAETPNSCSWTHSFIHSEQYWGNKWQKDFTFTLI